LLLFAAFFTLARWPGYPSTGALALQQWAVDL
jgi:hypothetical protein